jgi:tRNA A-37 threonylcarbamoyl transferase component Bud32
MQKDSEDVFFRIVAPLLHRYGQKLIVPKSVINEISRHDDNKNDNIIYAKNILNSYQEHGLYVIEKKFDENFADNAITSLFHSLRLKYNLCLITNDNSYKKNGNLSQDILDLKKSRSTNGIKDIRVFFIQNKQLIEFKDEIKYKKLRTTDNSTNKTPKFAFEISDLPRKNDYLLNTSKIPEENSFVFDNLNNKHFLIKKIGRTGGEGSVYLTDTNYICKIYKQDRVTNFRYEKIKLLIDNDIKVNGVCLPELIAFNQHKEFSGYLMQKANGNEIKTSIFMPQLFKQKFPNWDRWHLAKVSLKILKIIKALHSHNIVLGDINPSNILIENEENIFFIDTDSFQIEDIPCSVGMIPYTRIRHHGKRYEDYLRTQDDDIFALTTLIFQMMLPGKLPYSFSGGGSEKENMNPSNFPYKCGDSGYNNAPEGQWVYIWSHLPKKLRLTFCKVFRKGESILIDELIDGMQTYLHQLEKGHQTRDVFPLTFKQIDSQGNIVDDIKKITCKTCGDIFAIPNRIVDDYKVKNRNLPTQCEICRNLKKNCTKCRKTIPSGQSVDLCENCSGIYIKCSQCYSQFFFSDGEKKFFDKKGLSYPKKCKNCKSNSSSSKPVFNKVNNSSKSNNVGDIFSIIGKLFNF